MVKFKLSFDDSAKIESRKGNKTTVVLRPYITESCVDMLANATDDYFVHKCLTRHGFDYHFGYYNLQVKGSCVLADGDVDDQGAATRIATTKAKLKAFRIAKKVLDEVTQESVNRSLVVSANLVEMNRLVANEEEGLNHCIETGYCDPRR